MGTLKGKKPSLDQQLKEIQSAQNELSKKSNELIKKQQEIQDKIEEEKKKRQPKTITDRVKTMADILKIAKPTAEELKLIKYSGKSKRMCFARNFLIISLISEVLNEGWSPKMDGTERRYYPWFYLSSGFSFCDANFVNGNAVTSSAARLCLKTPELAKFAATVFEKEYKTAITSK